MLIEMLHASKPFQELNTELKDTYLVLAQIFEQDDDYLFYSPVELHNHTNRASVEHWKQFLKLDPVKQYIQQEVAAHTEIAFRKGLLASSTQAELGNIQAIKEVNDLKGVYEKQDSNKVIILHRIQRPEVQV